MAESFPEGAWMAGSEALRRRRTSVRSNRVRVTSVVGRATSFSYSRVLIHGTINFVLPGFVGFFSSAAARQYLTSVSFRQRKANLISRPCHRDGVALRGCSDSREDSRLKDLEAGLADSLERLG